MGPPKFFLCLFMCHFVLAAVVHDEQRLHACLCSRFVWPSPEEFLERKLGLFMATQR